MTLLKKVFMIKKVKTTVPWTYVIEDLLKKLLKRAMKTNFKTQIKNSLELKNQ